MRSACLTLLVALGGRGAGASGDEPLDFRVDMEGEVTFNSRGTSDIALTMMTETMGIVCYSDWFNPEDGKCNAMDFSSSAAPVKGDPLELAGDIAIDHQRKSLRFTLARFSDTMAVVCYTRFGLDPGRAVCKVLTLSGSGESATLSAGSAFDYASNATKYVHSMSVVSLSETKGVLCYQDTGTVYQFTRHLTCQVLNVQGNDLSSPAVNTTYVNDLDYLDNIVNVSMVSVSDSVSMVCYGDGTKNEAWCNQLSVSESGEELHVGSAFRLGEKLPGEFVPGGSGARVLITALSESNALGCFCSTEAGPTCVPLNLANGTQDSSAITEAGDPLEVGMEMCSEVTVTGMSETGAIVCYLAGEGESRVGTCSGLVLNHGKDLSAGDPEEIPDAAGVQTPGAFTSASPCQENPCDDWIAVDRRDGANAVVCYAASGGSESGRCQALSIPPPTSTTTATTSSETSSTSEHSTTATSTSTATKTSTLSTTTTASTTTATTTSETSSTTPHTTSQTATATTTTAPETSSAGAPQVAACLAATLTSWMLF